ncbi:MAG: hypothetical protein H0V23_09230 [Nocardioidaceae bacterium]|nr:hypothetical protein [Nocardioidaceae bacterium]
MDSAKRQLIRLGISPHISRDADDRGQVVGTSPQAGASAPADGGVQVLVGPVPR